MRKSSKAWENASVLIQIHSGGYPHAEQFRVSAQNPGDRKIIWDIDYERHLQQPIRSCTFTPSWCCQCEVCKVAYAVHKSQAYGGHDTKPQNLRTASYCTRCGYFLPAYRSQKEDGCPGREIRNLQRRVEFAEGDLRGARRGLEEAIRKHQGYIEKAEKDLAAARENLRLAKEREHE